MDAKLADELRIRRDIASGKLAISCFVKPLENYFKVCTVLVHSVVARPETFKLSKFKRVYTGCNLCKTPYLHVKVVKAACALRNTCNNQIGGSSSPGLSLNPGI